MMRCTLERLAIGGLVALVILLITVPAIGAFLRGVSIAVFGSTLSSALGALANIIAIASLLIYFIRWILPDLWGRGPVGSRTVIGPNSGVHPQTQSNDGEGVHRESVPAIARDRELLLKIFEKAMPPAFVKEYSSEQAAPHIMQSDALVRYQRSPETELMPPGGRRAVIKRDHLAADKRTLEEGYARQLEFTDMVSGDRERLILTEKTRIEHEGRCYIAGWYVPVERPRQLPADSKLCLKSDFHQIVYKLATAKPGEGTLVHIGEALRQAEDPSSHNSA